jgi:uncharacterized Fe-S cluster protein YjdI/CDGSH-type Zn-finger protein
MTTEYRKQPGVEREYENDDIVVYWEPGLCVHVGRCLRILPEVFDVDARPWVNISAANADEIAEAILACPSGALQFRRKDGGPQEEPPEQTIVRLRPNGPMYVQGHIRIEGPGRKLLRETTRAALCRCGASQNKPYCDNSHRKIDWKSA